MPCVKPIFIFSSALSFSRKKIPAAMTSLVSQVEVMVQFLTTLSQNNQPEFLSPYFNKVTAPAMTPQVNNADQLARVSNANQISVDESSQYLTPPTDINQASDPSVNNFDTIQPETAQAGDVFASGDGTDSLRTTGIGTEKEGARNVVYEDSAVNA